MCWLRQVYQCQTIGSRRLQEYGNSVKSKIHSSGVDGSLHASVAVSVLPKKGDAKMVRAVATASLVALMSCGAFGQPPEASLAFEVVSGPGGPRGGFRPQADGLTGTNVTLKQLLLFAYEGLHSAQISGPGWIETDSYDITVKAENSITAAQRASMLQALLADRLRLKSHRETREIPVYGLVVAKGGPKLRDVKEGEAAFAALTKAGKSPFKPGLMVITTPKDFSGFTDRLGGPLDRPVLDKTEIKGRFWFQLE